MHCAKWGVCGALYLQSAIAGPNVFPDGTSGRLRFIRSVDYKVLCNLPLRTVSGQGCSSTKQSDRCDVRLLCRSYLRCLRFGLFRQKRLHSFISVLKNTVLYGTVFCVYFFNIIFSFLNINPISSVKSTANTRFETIASTTPSGDAVIPITEDIAIPLPRKGTK